MKQVTLLARVSPDLKSKVLRGEENKTSGRVKISCRRYDKHQFRFLIESSGS